MDISRRCFLKLTVAAAASAAMPDIVNAVLIEEKTPIPAKHIDLGYVREVIGYDIVTDMYQCRYDISTGQTKLSVMFPKPSTHIIARDGKDATLHNIRREALQKLSQKMRDNNIKVRDLIKLPLPNYIESRYIA